LVGLFVCSTMAWLLAWAAAASLWQGSAPVLVASGSMGPSVRAGDLVILEPYHSQELTPGTVIRFDDPDGRGSVLHRVVEVDEDGSLRTKGDANTVVDSSAVDAGRITGVGRVLVPRAGLPVLWWRLGSWLALGIFAAVALSAIAVARYALLDVHDPWRVEPVAPPPRPPLPIAAREAIDRFRDEVARDGPVMVSRRVVLRRGAELTALGLAVAFLGSSRTAWAAYLDTTANSTNHFAAGSLNPATGLGTAPAGCDDAPSISLVGTGATGTAVNGDTAALTLDKPSGVVAGDLLIAHVVLHTHAFGPDPITAPGGWTTIRIDTDDNHVTAGVFWKRAAGSEPSDYTFVNDSGDTTQQATGVVLAYRGVAPVDPIDDDAGSTDLTGADNVVAPSVTTTEPSARLLSLVGVYGNSQGPATPPGGMTERYEGTVQSEASVVEILGEAADQTVAAAGATGTRTTSVPSADTWVAHTVALRPDRGDPGAELTWTPSTSPDVEGYLIERRIGGTLDATATVSPRTASSYTDGPLVAGTTYTYRVIATAGTWRSAPVTTTFTPGGC
jgi:signal peptidase I